MKRFSNTDCLINDISRSAYSYKPLFQESNNLQNNSISSVFKNASLKPQNDSIYKTDVTTFHDLNGEINKIQMLSQDNKQKDNKINHLQIVNDNLKGKITTLNKEINKYQKLTNEVAILKEKLKDYYNLQNKVTVLETQTMDDKEKIVFLKQIILKQHRKYNPTIIKKDNSDILTKPGILKKPDISLKPDILMKPDILTKPDISSVFKINKSSTEKNIIENTNEDINEDINEDMNENINKDQVKNVNDNLLRVVQRMKSDATDECILLIFKELNITNTTEINSEIINSIIEKL
jgi:hypothetical protein